MNATPPDLTRARATVRAYASSTARVVGVWREGRAAEARLLALIEAAPATTPGDDIVSDAITLANRLCAAAWSCPGREPLAGWRDWTRALAALDGLTIRAAAVCGEAAARECEAVAGGAP